MNRNTLITVIGLILILILVFLATGCEKEYSCEDCLTDFRFPPLKHPVKFPPRDSTDTVVTPPVDTVLNDLISYYDFYIEDNTKIKKIYFDVGTKFHPGHYYITDSIPIQDRPDGYYNGSFNLKNYLDMSLYFKNDTFPIRYEIRYRNGNIIYADSVTLIY